MSALGMSSLGTQCHNIALGMSSMGVICPLVVSQPRPTPVSVSGGGYVPSSAKTAQKTSQKRSQRPILQLLQPLKQQEEETQLDLQIRREDNELIELASYLIKSGIIT